MKSFQWKAGRRVLTGLAVVLGSPAFAFNVQINNQGPTDVRIKAGGQTVCTVAHQVVTVCSLDPYTAYSAVYTGTYAEQGLFTIQKYTNQVLQTTPVNADPARANFVIQVVADQGSGSVDNFIAPDGSFHTSGICSPDTGGVTCTLAQGASLQNLYLALLEYQVPKPPEPQPPTPSTDYSKDYGAWDSTRAYDPTWVPQAQYPAVQYNGKKWLACSHADAGAVPGVTMPWNAWVEWDGSSRVCH